MVCEEGEYNQVRDSQLKSAERLGPKPHDSIVSLLVNLLINLLVDLLVNLSPDLCHLRLATHGVTIQGVTIVVCMPFKRQTVATFSASTQQPPYLFSKKYDLYWYASTLNTL